MATKRTDEEFIEAAKKATYMREMLRILGMRTFNYKSLRKRLSRLNISTEHWVPFTHFQFKKNHELNIKPLLEQLVEYAPNLKASDIRHKLIKGNYMVYECSRCKITEYNNEPLTLHLDHINGINTDYRLENLRLLCPNCHSQTDTYCGRNIKYDKKPIKENICVCGEKMANKSKFCNKCSTKNRTKANWPSYEEMLEQLKTKTNVQLAKELGVTETAVRKKLKRYYDKSINKLP